MKSTKILLIFILALSVLSCKKNDDDTETSAFLLTAENLAGTHALTFLTVDVEETTEINGIPVTSTITAVGSTFQVEIIFRADGTYVIEGQYLLTTTVTVAGQTEMTTEIIVLDEGGTFSLDANEQTIFISGSGDELGSGTFDITLFNETDFRVTQTQVITAQGVSGDVITEYRFERL
ncbi:MAG: hypothetical protein AAF489_01185 [Bacteroidota bacterium]